MSAKNGHPHWVSKTEYEVLAPTKGKGKGKSAMPDLAGMRLPAGIAAVETLGRLWELARDDLLNVEFEVSLELADPGQFAHSS